MINILHKTSNKFDFLSIIVVLLFKILHYICKIQEEICY